MDFMSISSINSYVKNMDMQQKWQTKKSTGNYSADGKKSVSQWLESQNKKAEENEEKKRNDPQLKNIHNKMSTGQRLTPSEKQYLQKKDPQSYQKLRNIEAEQEQFERDLRRCKTKDEVRRLKLSHAAASLNTVNTVKNDPYITEDKKREIIATEQQKVSAIERSARDFVKSGEYSSLPTEAEKHRAEKLLKEAEEAKRRPEKQEEFARKEEPAKKRPVQKPETESDRAVREAKKTEKKAETSESRPAERMAKKAKAENSPEVKKVKRNKNKRDKKIYRQAAPVVSAKGSLDTKA